jgi:hypothetical protein
LPATAIAACAIASGALAAPKDCSVGPVPDTPVAGTVGGKPFVPNEITLHITPNGMQVNDAKFDTYELSIQTDGIFNAMSVHVLVRAGGRPDGHVYRVLPTDSISAQPAAAPGTPEIQGWDLALESAGIDTSFTRDIASMRLEFGPRKAGMIQGKIHFCVPGAKAEIAGAFNAKPDR